MPARNPSIPQILTALKTREFQRYLEFASKGLPVAMKLPVDGAQTIPGSRRASKISPAKLQASIARGEEVFNSKPITITDVAGLNDDLGISSIQGTCGICHDTPNVGNHSFPAPLNIGVGDPDGPGRTSLDISYLPTITLRNKSTGDIKRTTDVGRAMITGKWKHIGRLKGPILRGLASRAPYFHNGSAKTLTDAVDFYDKRFLIGFTAQEKADLVAFLNAL